MPQYYVLWMSLCNLFSPFSELQPLFGAGGRLPSKAWAGFLLATAQSTFGPFESGIKTFRNGVVCWQKTQWHTAFSVSAAPHFFSRDSSARAVNPNKLKLSLVLVLGLHAVTVETEMPYSYSRSESLMSSSGVNFKTAGVALKYCFVWALLGVERRLKVSY